MSTQQRRAIPPDAISQICGYLINEKPKPQELREWVETWLDTYCPNESAKAALERARVIEVLDRWAHANDDTYRIAEHDDCFMCVSTERSLGDGATPDAARATAAAAIERGEL